MLFIPRDALKYAGSLQKTSRQDVHTDQSFSDMSIASSAGKATARKGKWYQHELDRVQSLDFQLQKCPSAATKAPVY